MLRGMHGVAQKTIRNENIRGNLKSISSKGEIQGMLFEMVQVCT